MPDAPPPTLIARPPAVVSFDSGTPGREGPLTLGQLNILRWLSDAPESFDSTLERRLTFPDGLPIDVVMAVLRTMIARHEGLRTIFDLSSPPRQQVLGRGSTTVEIYEIAPETPTPRQCDVLVEALQRRWRPGTACGPTQMPIWVALAVRSGMVYAAYLRFSHLVVDEQAMEVLRREFVELLAAPAAAELPAPRRQPVDQAHVEAQPSHGKRVDRALRYRERMLRQMPVSLYPAPQAAGPAESVAVDMRSPAAALALRRLAARTGRSRPSAVLAAVCALLSHHTGDSQLVFPTLASNRFEPDLRDYVGTLVQTAFIQVDVDGATFDELVRRVWLAVMAASERGMYDVARSSEIDRRIAHERGVHFAFEPLFNSPVVDSPDDRELPSSNHVREARTATTVSRTPMRRTYATVRFDLYEYHDVVHLRLWSGDTRRIPAETAETLLLALERLLVAASEGDLDQMAMSRALGLTPFAGGPDWLRVDGCWVQVSEVQRLLDEALAPAPAKVFPAVNGRELVGYVAMTDAVRTPEQAHARCLSVLPDRPTAMTPRYYVLCETAPDDLDDPSAWRSVCAEGTGRIAMEPLASSVSAT